MAGSGTGPSVTPGFARGDINVPGGIRYGGIKPQPGVTPPFDPAGGPVNGAPMPTKGGVDYLGGSSSFNESFNPGPYRDTIAPQPLPSRSKPQLHASQWAWGRQGRVFINKHLAVWVQLCVLLELN